jgi:hypothetical protein
MARDNFSTMRAAVANPAMVVVGRPEILRIRHDSIAVFRCLDFFLGKVCGLV